MTSKTAAISFASRCKNVLSANWQAYPNTVKADATGRYAPASFHRTMTSKTAAISFASRCKNVLSANWQAYLNTVKADATGSKQDIYTSKVLYSFRRGVPYLWVHDTDLHNTNTIIDERGSLAVISAVPGPLVGLLTSLRKMPARVALAGEVIPLKDEKAKVITENLRESVLLEEKAVSEASYTVSALLSSARISCRLRSEKFQEMLDQSSNYVVYKFNVDSCTYVDGGGNNHDVEWDHVKVPKAELLLPFSEKLIDGINQSQTRRRALMVFCFEYHNVDIRDALMLSIDHNGFDVLAKVPEGPTSNSHSPIYAWKEFRFSFNEEASDIEDFCRLLVVLEEEAVERINVHSGLGLKTKTT